MSWFKGLFGRGKDTASDVGEAAQTASQTVQKTAQKASEAVQNAAPARPSRRSRKSDIVDEEGRSAEEIAAEAAQEFDISAVARKAAEMDAVERAGDGVSAVKDSAVEAVETVQDGLSRGAQQASDAATGAAESARDMAADAAETASEMAQSAAQGASDMAGAAAETASEAASGLKTTLADGAAAASAAAAGVAGSAAAAAEEEQDTPFAAESYAARDAFWDKVGQSDSDLISYIVNPQFRGAPPWPDTRQAYRLVRTGDSLIIASDGLTDPFAGKEDQGRQNGYGMEVFIEIPGWQDRPMDEVNQSWAFRAIENFAHNVAHAGGFGDKLDSYGVMSMELPGADLMPEGWAAPNGNGGALINVPMAPGMNMIEDMPIAPVRVVPLTLITPAELAAIADGGAEARKALSQELISAGIGHRTDPNRASLR